MVDFAKAPRRAPLTADQFPILHTYEPARSPARKLWETCPRWVPWALVEPHEPQAWVNHGQTLRRLAERGGLGPDELWCVMHRKHWRERPTLAEAIAWVRTLVPPPCLPTTTAHLG
jgi:hypothetical protein